MASLHGIKIKNLKSFMGMEGISYQGDLWLGKEKIGFWSQDGDGAPDFFEFRDDVSFDRFNALCADTNKPFRCYDGTDIPYDADMFMYDLLTLTLDEKNYKKSVKDGYDFVVKTKSAHIPETTYAFKDYSVEDAKKWACEQNKEKVERLKKLGSNEELTCRVFTSLKDFNVGEPYTMEQIAG